MSDGSEIDAALVAKLQGDATLAALMPAGAFAFMEDEVPQGLTRFVKVALVDEADRHLFEGRASEDAEYIVEAVIKADAGGNIKAAAARIDALLDLGTLTIPGYHVMLLRRVRRIRMTEVDDQDASIRWHRRGGHYQLMAAPAAT